MCQDQRATRRPHHRAGADRLQGLLLRRSGSRARLTASVRRSKFALDIGLDERPLEPHRSLEPV
jgi:hypothetical protein